MKKHTSILLVLLMLLSPVAVYADANSCGANQPPDSVYINAEVSGNFNFIEEKTVAEGDIVEFMTWIVC